MIRLCFFTSSFIYPMHIIDLVTKMNNTIIGIAVVAVIIGAVVGIVAYPYAFPTEETTTEWTAQDTTPTRVATLDVTIDNSSFADFTSDVDANGSIATDASKTGNITVYNNDTTDSGTLTITLVNTINGEEGLNNALEIDEFVVKLTVTSGLYTTTKYLQKDGDYTVGFDFGTLEKDSYTTIQVTVEGEACDDDTFLDGKTYNCELYIIQGTSSYDKVDWTVTT